MRSFRSNRQNRLSLVWESLFLQGHSKLKNINQSSRAKDSENIYSFSPNIVKIWLKEEIVMKNAMDYAKFFLKQEDDKIANTMDGNMKLQKLLSFANMISIAKYGHPLFAEPVLAYENGFVVESVRQRYKNDYAGLKNDSGEFNPDFSEEEYRILNDTLGIFGRLQAKELSNLSHEFSSWKKAYEKGFSNGFHYKESSEVDFSSEEEDLSRIRAVIGAYEKEKNTPFRKEVINGSTFYIPYEFYSDELMRKLELFSMECSEDSYTVTYNGEELVVY